MIERQVLQTVQKHRLLCAGDRVTAAVSGGADSVAMLHILYRLQQELDIVLDAVHVNHHLRGAESQRDAAFVRELCERLQISLRIYDADIPAICADTKEGVEAAARRERYRILQQHAAGGKIATAHTLSDTAETLLLHIARGTGIHGLRGIPMIRQNIIRPMLELTRSEVEQYLQCNGLEYVEDSSNASDRYNRNKIRHHVIPVLQQINPNFLSAVKRLTEHAAQIDDDLRQTAGELIDSGADVQQLCAYTDAVLCGYVQLRCARELGIDPEQVHIRQAVQVIRQKNGRCQLPGGCFFWVSGGQIRLTGERPQMHRTVFCEAAHLGTVATPYRIYHISVLAKKDFLIRQKVHNLLFKNALDYAKISENLWLRSREDGDRINIAGRGCTKTLKKLYNEQRIPVWERGELAVLTDGKQLLWAERLGVAQTVAVGVDTECVLLIEPQP